MRTNWISGFEKRQRNWPKRWRALKSEIAQHKRTAQGLQTQFGAVESVGPDYSRYRRASRRSSIFQVVIRRWKTACRLTSGASALYDAHAAEVVVNCVGVRSEALAMELAMTQPSPHRHRPEWPVQCVAAAGIRADVSR